MPLSFQPLEILAVISTPGVLPIMAYMGGSAQKEYLSQASGIMKG